MEATKVFFADPQTPTSTGPATAPPVGPISAPLGGDAERTEGAATSVPTSAPPGIPADDLLHLEDESTESANNGHEGAMRMLVNAMKAFHIVDEDEMKAFDRCFPIAESPRKENIDIGAILDEDIPKGVLFQYPLVSSNLTGYVHDVELPQRKDPPMLVKPGVDEETLDAKLESLRKSRIVPSQSPWALELYSALEYKASMSKAENNAALVNKDALRASDLIDFGAPVQPADVPSKRDMVAPTSDSAVLQSYRSPPSEKTGMGAPSTRSDVPNDHQRGLMLKKVAVTPKDEKNKVRITPVPVKSTTSSSFAPGNSAVGGSENKGMMVASGPVKGSTALVEQPRTSNDVAAVNQTQKVQGTRAKDGSFNKTLLESRWAPRKVDSVQASDVRHARRIVTTATPPPRAHTSAPTTPFISGGLSQSRWAPGGRSNRD